MSTIQIFIGLLTIIGSGVCSAVVTYTLNARKSERDFTRGKLEALWEVTHKFGINEALSFDPFLELLAGKITQNEAKRRFVERSPVEDQMLFQTIEMLVHIYFRPLLPQYSDLVNSRIKLLASIHRLTNEEVGILTQARYYTLNLELHGFLESIRELKKGIVSIAPRWEGNQWSDAADSIMKALRENRLFPPSAEPDDQY